MVLQKVSTPSTADLWCYLVHSVEHQVIGNSLGLLSCESESHSFETFVINSIGHVTGFQLMQAPAGRADWIQILLYKPITNICAV